MRMAEPDIISGPMTMSRGSSLVGIVHQEKSRIIVAG
jgi:hypothetical protein